MTDPIHTPLTDVARQEPAGKGLSAPSMADMDPAEMDRAADAAADVLKVLANPARLRLLCALVPGEQSVGELEEKLGASQSYVSGQLARMRTEGLVSCSRDGRTIRYQLADPRVRPILERLYEVFCPKV
jgi:ArsR family transcriptional regulator